nr:tRNA lysidine(34) synthetase TilS [Corynebacterium lactis]
MSNPFPSAQPGAPTDEGRDDSGQGRRPFWPDYSPHFLKVRHRVRSALRSIDAGAIRTSGVVIGLSGGADSLALLAGACAETFGPKGALVGGPVHAVVVDHRLQDGSADVARRAADTARSLGATAEVVVVDIDKDSPHGPEYAARIERHRALREVARRRHAPLLLAHTLDDQAETVLLRLARGGGPQALSAIRDDLTWSDGTRILRPLLSVRRADTKGCCTELGLSPWEDPHNDDPAFARVRVRRSILPLLERELGPGVAENLAKTAALAALDNDSLDSSAEAELTSLLEEGRPSASERGGGELPVSGLATLDDAVATRVIGRWVRRSGGEPNTKQIDAIMALVRNYHGQGAVQVPVSGKVQGGARPAGARLVVARKDGTLQLSEE